MGAEKCFEQEVTEGRGRIIGLGNGWGGAGELAVGEDGAAFPTLLLEDFSPAGVDRGGILQEARVKPFDEIDIRSGKVGVLEGGHEINVLNPRRGRRSKRLQPSFHRHQAVRAPGVQNTAIASISTFAPFGSACARSPPLEGRVAGAQERASARPRRVRRLLRSAARVTFAGVNAERRWWIALRARSNASESPWSWWAQLAPIDSE